MTDDRLTAVMSDLTDLGDRLESLLEQATEAQWRTPTPADGWDVATSVGHLAWTDEAATLAARAHEGDEATQAWDALVREALGDPDGFVDAAARSAGDVAPVALLRRWRRSRAALATALGSVPDGVRLPWFGPPMAPASMATARCMETWAHGQDVADALGVRLGPGGELQHVAHLGVRTRDFAFGNHDLEPPAEQFRVELESPDGDTWTWGPEDATQRVHGPAEHFALLVTQRRHRDDLDLVATGEDADRWLDVAQAFAGPPGGGRGPRPTDG